MTITPKLEHRSASHQNAIDIFAGDWITKIDEVYPGVTSGSAGFLRSDGRPAIAANHLGFVKGSLHGMKVLELGPQEGQHTYNLCKLGAESVVAVEANTFAYLRALIVKEILRFDCQFLLGDALKYLQNNKDRYDLIFCSGVLYHMVDPYAMIKAMSERTDRIFLWTHYYNPITPGAIKCIPKEVERAGTNITYYEHYYGIDIDTQPFWGGTEPNACWLSKNDMVKIFESFGYNFTIIIDDVSMNAGPSITAAAIRD